MQLGRSVIGMAIAALGGCIPALADVITFDFDNAPLRTPLPVSLTVGGIKADFAATGQGFSIQPASTMGFTPAGFSGLIVYPSSVNLSDLHVSFSQPLTDFSILYADQENGCDTAALMRVTAYLKGAYVGTSTAMANAGTWPSAKLAFSSAATFDSVIVHYDTPPTGENWGPVFMADNMVITTAAPVPEPSGMGAVGLLAGKVVLRRRPREQVV